MLTFNLPVVNRNCFLISVFTWCMGYYLLAWILFVMVAAVEYDEVKSLYSNYEEYYNDRMEQERGKNTDDLSADAHILDEQIRLYTQENPGVSEQLAHKLGEGDKFKQYSYNYHETENADLDNDSSGPRTHNTEVEAFWTEMIYKDWYHPTGIVMPEAIHYNVHSVCMYHSYYTYKNMKTELNLITINMALPNKVMSCKANEIKCSAGLRLNTTYNNVMQECELKTYATGELHETAYKRVALPLAQEVKEYKYVWV